MPALQFVGLLEAVPPEAFVQRLVDTLCAQVAALTPSARSPTEALAAEPAACLQLAEGLAAMRAPPRTMEVCDLPNLFKMQPCQRSGVVGFRSLSQTEAGA